jgi:hypothetical protein
MRVGLGLCGMRSERHIGGGIFDERYIRRLGPGEDFVIDTNYQHVFIPVCQRNTELNLPTN